MKSLIITYKAFRIIPCKIRRSFPEQWHEVTPRQLIAIANMYKSNITDRRAAKLIFRLPWFVSRMLDKYETYVLLSQLDFVSDFKPHHSFIIPYLGSYYPPRPRLEHMTFGQFMFVDTYFGDYAQSNKTGDLCKFAAALYLRQGEKFSEANIVSRVDEFRHFPHIKLEAIAINYRLIREWITINYPILFRPNDKHVEPKTATGGWLRILESLVGDDVINTDKYVQMTVHQVLRFITKKIKGK